MSELETAKQLAPDSPGVRSHLAMVYSKLGRTREAKAESDAFLTLKNKEDVMAPAKVKLRRNAGEHSLTRKLPLVASLAVCAFAAPIVPSRTLRLRLA